MTFPRPGEYNLMSEAGAFRPNSSRFLLNSHLSYQNVSTYGSTVGGCRQSLSGSETDISTSNENLTHEEKYVLRNSTRQEPQGEETLEAEESGGGGGATVFQGGPSNRTALNSSYASMDQSSCGTLIIHKDIDDDDEEEDEEDEDMTGVRLRALNLSSNPQNRYDLQGQVRQHLSLGNYYGNPSRQHSYESELKAFEVLPKEIIGIPKHYLDQSQVLKHLAFEVQKTNSGNLGMDQLTLAPPHDNSSQYQQTTFFGSDFDVTNLPPPPEYPGKLKNGPQNIDNCNSTTPTTTDSSPATTPAEVKTPLDGALVKSSAAISGIMGVHSRSQPDLSQVGRWDDAVLKKSTRPKTKGKASPEISSQVLHQRVHSAKYGYSSSDILSMDKFSESLIFENRSIRAELELYKNKVSRLQKFEVDIQKIHQAYEDLVKSSQKRESLDQAVRSKLQIQIRRQQDINRDLKDAMNSQMFGKQSGVQFPNLNEKMRHDMQCRDQLITQLIQQNKELTAAKERHEIELAAQRATLHEQRNHIDILDKALNNAQSNVVKLEEECRKKQVFVDRVTQLQKALKHAQVVSERREQMERRLRNRLERDLEELRQRLHKLGEAKNSDGDGSGNKDDTSMNANGEDHLGSSSKVSGVEMTGPKCPEEGIDTLKRTIREKEEKIIALASEVSKWEQHYMEENTMRQIAIDAASMPKDAKIAALERTSQESEKLIAQARSDKLKQMDELHASNKRCADLEARLKELESQLAERDAMIKVLQKQSFDRDLAFQSAMMRSPRNPSHPSYQLGSTSGNSSKSSPSSGRSNSLSAVSPTLPLVPSSPTNSSTSSAQESLDDQLKKLDSELLSKNSIIQALRSEKAKYPNHYWMV